ncbi:hypothetical protein DY000_02048956 [Brassica cretica]|uniref:Aspartic peptidase DDI1-type domain-containing protein n=1 Tax=Brassica cretica TaxID=69181 RepID=A0ABQ7EX56_BRACR|nr:hypothetical protein DY000_02048956 [Brassica cretica]
MFFRETRETEEDIRRMFCEAREKMRMMITLKKKSDPGQFPIPCTVKGIEFPYALCDTGASVSILPRVMADHLGLQVEPSQELFTFVDCSQRNSGEIVRDLDVQIESSSSCLGKNTFQPSVVGESRPSIDTNHSQLIDINNTTSIDICPKPKTTVSEKDKSDNQYLTPDKFDIFKDPDGYARAIDGLGAVCNLQINQVCLTLIDPNAHYDPIPVKKPQTTSRRINDPGIIAASHCGAEYETEYSASIETHTATSIDSHHQILTNNAYFPSIDTNVDATRDRDYSIGSWAYNRYHESYAVETTYRDQGDDELIEEFTYEDLLNMQRRNETDQNQAASAWERTRFSHPIDRESCPSIDINNTTSIDIRPKLKTTVSEKDKSDNQYLTPDEFDIFRNPDGYARAIDGRTLHVSREDIADILQTANGADNLFIHQRNIPEHKQKATKEFNNTAGGTKKSFKQRTRHPTQPSIDVDAPTSVDRMPEFGRRAFDLLDTRRFYWEEKDEDIRRLLERASRDEPSYICLPEHASSFTQTKLVPEIYTKDEINEMFYEYQLADDLHGGYEARHSQNSERDRHCLTYIDRQPLPHIDRQSLQHIDRQPHTSIEEKIDGRCDDIYFPMDLSISALTSMIEAIQGEFVEIQSYIARRPEASPSIDRRNSKSTNIHQSLVHGSTSAKKIWRLVSQQVPTFNITSPITSKVKLNDYNKALSGRQPTIRTSPASTDINILTSVDIHSGLVYRSNSLH